MTFTHAEDPLSSFGTKEENANRTIRKFWKQFFVYASRKPLLSWASAEYSNDFLCIYVYISSMYGFDFPTSSVLTLGSASLIREAISGAAKPT